MPFVLISIYQYILLVLQSSLVLGIPYSILGMWLGMWLGMSMGNLQHAIHLLIGLNRKSSYWYLSQASKTSMTPADDTWTTQQFNCKLDNSQGNIINI